MSTLRLHFCFAIWNDRPSLRCDIDRCLHPLALVAAHPALVTGLLQVQALFLCHLYFALTLLEHVSVSEKIQPFVDNYRESSKRKNRIAKDCALFASAAKICVCVWRVRVMKSVKLITLTTRSHINDRQIRVWQRNFGSSGGLKKKGWNGGNTGAWTSGS